MNRRNPLRLAWGLATIGGATAVGVTTQRPGFVAITFIGGLLLPHVLGFGWAGPHRHGPWGHGGPGCHGHRAGARGGATEETVTA